MDIERFGQPRNGFNYEANHSFLRELIFLIGLRLDCDPLSSDVFESGAILLELAGEAREYFRSRVEEYCRIVNQYHFWYEAWQQTKGLYHFFNIGKCKLNNRLKGKIEGISKRKIRLSCFKSKFEPVLFVPDSCFQIYDEIIQICLEDSLLREAFHMLIDAQCPQQNSDVYPCARFVISRGYVNLLTNKFAKQANLYIPKIDQKVRETCPVHENINQAR